MYLPLNDYLLSGFTGKRSLPCASAAISVLAGRWSENTSRKSFLSCHDFYPTLRVCWPTGGVCSTKKTSYIAQMSAVSHQAEHFIRPCLLFTQRMTSTGNTGRCPVRTWCVLCRKYGSWWYFLRECILSNVCVHLWHQAGSDTQDFGLARTMRRGRKRITYGTLPKTL